MTQFTSRAYHHWQGLCAHALLGALAGMLLLYPVTKAIYGAEWHSARSEVERLALAFTPSMLPMTGAFALLDGVLGLVFGLHHRLVAKQQRALGFLETEKTTKKAR